MSYIIVAEVDTTEEMNRALGDRAAIQPPVRVLRDKGDVLTSCIRAEFGEEKARTTDLCNALIQAGFVTFSIRHSY